MNRRVFLGVLSGALIVPLWSHAQHANNLPKIGLLSPFSSSDTEGWHKAFLARLRELGWVDGDSVHVEYRYADGRNELLPQLISELVGQKVDVIVTSVTNDTIAAKKATVEIPIVMAAAGDPVSTGIVQSLARPGGNVTGLSQMNTDLSGKRLELLREVSPQIASVAVLFNPDDPISALGLDEVRLSARKMGLEIHSFEVRDSQGLNRTFEKLTNFRLQALAILPNPVFVVNLKEIADFALRNKLPSIFHLAEFPKAGGLLSYGVDRTDMFRRAAVYVDKILRGAKPADLPIEQPTKFELVVNLKTARALDLAIPQIVLARADEVIE